MLEDLTLTENVKSIITVRRESAIKGIVETAIYKGILTPQSIYSHCVLIGAQIILKIPAKLDESDTSIKMKKKAKRYISEN